MGTTFLRAAIYVNGAAEVIVTKPSVLAFTSSGEMLFGDDARSQIARNPQNTIFDVKRLIGRPFDDPRLQLDMKRVWPFKVIDDHGIPKIEVVYQGGSKRFSAEEITSLLLKDLKETAEAHVSCKINNAVISVPVDFNLLQRLATKCASTMAGFAHVRLVSDPLAAALASTVANHFKPADQNVLIIDLGGGTLDAAVLRILDGGIVASLSISGNAHLGGDEFDNRMVAFFVDDFESKYGKGISNNGRALCRLRMACQRAKRILSESTEASIELDSLYDGIDYRSKISRTRFEDLFSALFQSLLESIERALHFVRGLEKKDIDEVILVGGSTRLPKVQKIVLDFLSGKRLNESIDPDEAVAYGTAIQAAVLSPFRDSVIDQVLVVDAVPHSLGIGIAGGVMEVVVHQNESIPTKKTKTFTTTCDNQSTVTIDVFEGDRAMAKDNRWIGRLNLSGLEPASRGIPQIVVTFDIEASGLTAVSVVETSRGKENKITVANEKWDGGGVSKEDVEQLVRHATKYALAAPNCEVALKE